MGLICGSLTIPTRPPRRPLAARLLRGAAGGLVGDGGARPLGLGHGAVVRHQLVRHRHTPLGLKASLKACTRTFAHHLLYVWTHAHALARPRRARPLRATHAHVQPVRDVWARGRSAPPRPSPRQAPRAVGRLDHLRGLLRNRTHVETRPVSCDHGQPGLRCCDWPRTWPKLSSALFDSTHRPPPASSTSRSRSSGGRPSSHGASVTVASSASSPTPTCCKTPSRGWPGRVGKVVLCSAHVNSRHTHSPRTVQ